jgi:hypothetical protein
MTGNRSSVNNVELPKISRSRDTPPGYKFVYLPNDSRFSVYLRGLTGDKAPYIDIPREDTRNNVLRLQPPANGQRWTFQIDTL